MTESVKNFIPAQDVQSLCWRGDELIDWVDGGVRYGQDGKKIDPHRRLSYRFDCATSSPDGRYAVVYERLGTKGILLDNGKFVRELNRSYYHANRYEYPIALFQLPDGRDVLVHCPEEYNALEIEEIESAKRLTQRDITKARDFFYSRLAVNSTQTILISAGWIWQPEDWVLSFDIERAIADPMYLNQEKIGCGVSYNREISSAEFLDPYLLLLSSSKDAIYMEEDEAPKQQTAELAIYDLTDRTVVSRTPVEEEIGTMMSVGIDHVIGFYEHPKLIEIKTGRIIEGWPDINSGKQNSSIIWGSEMPPPIAMDAANKRFAVASNDGIFVVAL